MFGTAYEQGVLGGSRKRSELVLRTEQDAHVTVRRIDVDGKQQYAWRKMVEGEK
jgi:hypothetical protein